VSLPRFAVSEEKNNWLSEKMEALGIRERDLEERFIRSSGPGGQKVNKTSTCVYLKHLPSGLEVKCMKERNQSINRFLARRELAEKIERMLGQPTAEDLRREKIRKQKLRRKHRSHRICSTKGNPANVPPPPPGTAPPSNQMKRCDSKKNIHEADGSRNRPLRGEASYPRD